MLLKYNAQSEGIELREKLKERRLTMAINRMRLRTTSICFASWVNIIDEKRNREALIKSFSYKFHNRLVLTSFNSWKSFVQTRFKQRYVFQRLLNKTVQIIA